MTTPNSLGSSAFSQEAAHGSQLRVQGGPASQTALQANMGMAFTQRLQQQALYMRELQMMELQLHQIQAQAAALLQPRRPVVQRSGL